jgi:hypothetical protein
MRNMKFNINNQEEEIQLTGRAYIEASVSIAVLEEPWIYRIIPSGWSNMYHVIKEYGDYETSEYIGILTAEQIKEEYQLEIPSMLDEMNSTIKRKPNDYDLGGSIRQMSNYIKDQTIKL